MLEKYMLCQSVRSKVKLPEIAPLPTLHRMQVLPTGAVEITTWVRAFDKGTELSVLEEYRAGRFWCGYPGEFSPMELGRDYLPTIRVDLGFPCQMLFFAVFPYYGLRRPDTGKFRLGRFHCERVDPFEDLRNKRLYKPGPLLTGMEDEEGEYELARTLRRTLEYYRGREFKDPQYSFRGIQSCIIA